MKRLLIVYNPRSSQYKKVKTEVLDASRKLKGYIVGKYEVERTDVDDNAKKFAKILKNDDLVLAVGGDATAVIAVNGIIQSGKDARLAVLPYGNFNDLARTLGAKKFEQIFFEDKIQKMWPLEILVDGKHFRYASSYVTIGMTAEAVEIFDDEKIRKKLQEGHKSSWRSYLDLMKWYFKNRRKKDFIPRFKLNGVEMPNDTTDYAALNGRSMARVMKGGDWFLRPKEFWHQTGRFKSLWRLSGLMIPAILKQTPGSLMKGTDVLEFLEPATVELQAEGEYRIFHDITKIEIRKAEQCLKVVTH